MHQTFTQLTLPEQADFITRHGQFIEAQDYYSFYIQVYLVGEMYVNLLYDFSGSLVGVEPASDQETIGEPDPSRTQPFSKSAS